MVHPHDKSFAARRDVRRNNRSPFNDPTHFLRLTNTSICSIFATNVIEFCTITRVAVAILHILLIDRVFIYSVYLTFFFLFFFFFRTIFIGLVFPTNRPNSDFTVWLFTRGNLSIGISVIHGKASVSSENTKTSCADGAYARCANIVAIIILRKAVSNNKYRLRLF